MGDEQNKGKNCYAINPRANLAAALRNETNDPAVLASLAEFRADLFKTAVDFEMGITEGIGSTGAGPKTALARTVEGQLQHQARR